MKNFIKAMIYSLFLAASLNIAPVMASGHSNGGNGPDQRGIDGRKYGSALEVWARKMGETYKGLARDGVFGGQGGDRSLILRPPVRPPRP